MEHMTNPESSTHFAVKKGIVVTAKFGFVFSNFSVRSNFVVEPTCDEQDAVALTSHWCMCVNLFVWICPDHNFSIYVWISKYVGTIVLYAFLKD